MLQCFDQVVAADARFRAGLYCESVCDGSDGDC